jgi:peptide-methionine (S)-S-oxide reductase
MIKNIKVAIFGGGCFWCTEAIFQRLRGVISVKPGYSGGTVKNPTYEQVSSGTTGHAEAIQIEFDPEQITFSNLLNVFFATHNPTTPNRQGHDIGTQYRSSIFYMDETQKSDAEKYIRELNEQDVYGAPVVTTLEPFTKFYEAENYHQNYYNQNSNQAYCQVVINPKLSKLREKFAHLLQ